MLAGHLAFKITFFSGVWTLIQIRLFLIDFSSAAVFLKHYCKSHLQIVSYLWVLQSEKITADDAKMVGHATKKHMEIIYCIKTRKYNEDLHKGWKHFA